MEKRKNISSTKNSEVDDDQTHLDKADENSIKSKTTQSIFEKFTDKIKTFLENAE